MALGVAASPWTARGDVATPVPACIAPVAGRAVAAEIDQRYVARGAEPFQVQSTVAPVPEPSATATPSASEIETCHGSALERRAWNRTGPVLLTSSRGSKILGPPILYASAAIAPSLP